MEVLQFHHWWSSSSHRGFLSRLQPLYFIVWVTTILGPVVHVRFQACCEKTGPLLTSGMSNPFLNWQVVGSTAGVFCVGRLPWSFSFYSLFLFLFLFYFIYLLLLLLLFCKRKTWKHIPGKWLNYKIVLESFFFCFCISQLNTHIYMHAYIGVACLWNA